MMVLQNKGCCEICTKSVKGELAKGSRDMWKEKNGWNERKDCGNNRIDVKTRIKLEKGTKKSRKKRRRSSKGLSYEIFGFVLWPVWKHQAWMWATFGFKNFRDVPSIMDNYFKFWCVSGQSFWEILKISEKEWQLSPWFSNFCRFLVSGSLWSVAEGVNTSRRFLESLRRIGYVCLVLQEYSSKLPCLQEACNINKISRRTIVNPSPSF